MRNPKTDLPLAVRCVASYAFPTERTWALDDARAVLNEMKPPPSSGVLLCTQLPGDMLVGISAAARLLPMAPNCWRVTRPAAQTARAS